VRETRYGRKVGCKELDHGKYVVVVFERRNENLIVVTSLKVDKGRLERYGFTGI
jgi:hypothetical protein